MRKLVSAVLTAAVASVIVVCAPPAFAYTHGCVSFGGFYAPVPPEIPDADYLGPVVPGVCRMRVFDQDTFTGGGTFAIGCEDGSWYWTHATADPPAVQIPIVCEGHTLLDVQTGTDGWVVAGAAQ